MTNELSSNEHRILRLWIRPVKGGPVEEQDSLELQEGEGTVGDHSFGGKRHVTVVFQEDWNDATKELGKDVDPSGRRANILVSGGNGRDWIGKRVNLGPVELEIHGETRPCPIMEKAAVGLQEALKPDVRAGVWGRVLKSGTLSKGDKLLES